MARLLKVFEFLEEGRVEMAWCYLSRHFVLKWSYLKSSVVIIVYLPCTGLGLRKYSGLNQPTSLCVNNVERIIVKGRRC